MRGMTGRLAVIWLAASAVVGVAGAPAAAGVCSPRTVSIGDSSVKEGTGLMSFKVLSSGCAGGHVQFETIPGAGGFVAATSGTDYVSTSGGLAWAPGEIGTKTITVNVFDDHITEKDEALTLSLLTPVGLSILDGTAQGVIVDDDGPDIGIDHYTTSRPFCGIEICVSCHLVVVMSRRVPFDVTVKLTASSGTALSGTDFTVTDTLVTIPKGTLQVQVPIPILDDANPELTEYFYMSISSPSVGQIESGDVAIIVLDNDA